MSRLLSSAGAGGSGGGDGGGGGRDDRMKKKMEDSPPRFDPDDMDDEQPFLEGMEVENPAAQGAGSSAAPAMYRGVRQYTPRDTSYRTTYVACINSRDSPHNNRQIWLGRYYDARAAAIAYDVFCFFNHHETFVNFPELLHLHRIFVPQRGISPDGVNLPITASDLERVKHTGIGIVRAFYPDACAAVHSRRNQKAMPAATNPALTAQERQSAATLQAAYHTILEEQIRSSVVAYIANQPPLARQFLIGAAHGVPQPLTAESMPVPPARLPLIAGNLDFSSIQIPSGSAQPPQPTAPTQLDFSAIQVPQHQAVVPFHGSTSGLPTAQARQAPTLPADRMRPITPSQHTQSPSPAWSLFSDLPTPSRNPQPRWTVNDPLGFQYRPPTWLPPQFQQRAQTPSRPAATHAASSSEYSLYRSLGIPHAENEPQGWRNPLIRSNVERGTGEGDTLPADAYSRAAEARLNEERLRAERLRAGSLPVEQASSPFPLVQRLNELSREAYDQLYGSRQQEINQRAAPRLDSRPGTSSDLRRQQWSSNPWPGPHADTLRSPLRAVGAESLGGSAFSSYRARDGAQAGGLDHNTIPTRRGHSGDHAATEEDQREVPLHRQMPEELPLFDVFNRQARATGEVVSPAPSGSNVRPPSQEGPSQHREGRPTSSMGTELYGPPYVRAPLLPDLNLSAEELLQGVSSAMASAPVDMRELQRVSTLGSIGGGGGGEAEAEAEQECSSQPTSHHPIEPEKREENEDSGKGKGKAKDS